MTVHFDLDVPLGNHTREEFRILALEALRRIGWPVCNLEDTEIVARIENPPPGTGNIVTVRIGEAGAEIELDGCSIEGAQDGRA